MIVALLFATAMAAPPSWSAREPIDVADRGLMTLAIALDTSRDAVVERARSKGWPVVDDTDSGAFLLRGRVLETYEAKLDRDDGRAADVRWELVERVDDEVVYEVTTRGWTDDKGVDPIVVAFTNLIARETFAAALIAPPAPMGPDLLRVAPCRTAPIPLPDRAAAMLPAIVDVKQGDVTGRGALISPDGIVMTGLPVRADGGKVGVTLHSGVTLDAKVVRTDASGVALLELPGEGFACVPAATQFQIGMPVYAMDGVRAEFGMLTGSAVLDATTFVQSDLKAVAGGPVLDATGGMVGAGGDYGFIVPFALARARLQLAWGGPDAEEEEPVEAVPVVALDEDDPPIVALTSRVCVFRPKAGDAVELEVGTRTVSLAGGEYACVWLPTGTHTVGLQKGVARASVELDAGDVRYFKVLGKLGVESDSQKAFDKAVAKKGLEQVL
jgi:hypothetical protein